MKISWSNMCGETFLVELVAWTELGRTAYFHRCSGAPMEVAMVAPMEGPLPGEIDNSNVPNGCKLR